MSLCGALYRLAVVENGTATSQHGETKTSNSSNESEEIKQTRAKLQYTWTLVWCDFNTESASFQIYDETHTQLLITLDITTHEISHVVKDNRDCIELKLLPSDRTNTGVTTLPEQTEYFCSHESSHDIEWWLSNIYTVQRQIKAGNKPSIPILTAPTREYNNKTKEFNTSESNSSENQSPIDQKSNENSEFEDSHSKSKDPMHLLRRYQPSLDSGVMLFERYTVYETTTTYYVVCSDRHYSRFRVLELNRTFARPTALSAVFHEDPKLYAWHEMEAKLQAIAQETRLTRVFTAFAIVGCIRFLQGYYFIFVTQRRKIGCIGGNLIYGIGATQQITLARPKGTNPETSTGVTKGVADVSESSASSSSSVSSSTAAVPNPSWTNWLTSWFKSNPEDDAEARYLGLFQLVDLTKDFYFSYSYDVTHSLQHNMTTEGYSPDSTCMWNHYLVNELKANLSPPGAADLIVPIVLGFYEQRKCSIFGRLVSVILLARRSRHFAGTRYLKRGVSDTGHVANDVETEQIIEDENMGVGKFSSYIQYRGSIPVFWSQETSATLPKPPINLRRIDPTYNATQKHFTEMFARYGSPVIAVNLIKQSEKKEREAIVGVEYINAVEHLNTYMPAEHRIRYIGLDYSRMSKQKGLNVNVALDKVASWTLDQTGFFCSAPKRYIGKNQHKQNPEKMPHDESKESVSGGEETGNWLEQKGVLRTNCIDCLDRTNVCQFCVGMRALGLQLYAMGINNTTILDSRSRMSRVLMHLYSCEGDAISMQYGGSEAHKNVKTSSGRTGDSQSNVTHHKEIVTSIRRYYNNSFTDMAKQDAINVFLGHYIPSQNKKHLWELESDYYLHNFEVSNGLQACENIRRRKKQVSEDGYIVVKSSDASDKARRREGYLRECRELQDDWWQAPLSAFEKPKFYRERKHRRKKSLVFLQHPANDQILIEDSMLNDAISQGRGSIESEKSMVEGKNSAHDARQRTSISNAVSDGFLQMYHPEELTSFDKALGHGYMKPMDLTSESTTSSGTVRVSRLSVVNEQHVTFMTSGANNGANQGKFRSDTDITQGSSILTERNRNLRSYANSCDSCMSDYDLENIAEMQNSTIDEDLGNISLRPRKPIGSVTSGAKQNQNMSINTHVTRVGRSMSAPEAVEDKESEKRSRGLTHDYDGDHTTNDKEYSETSSGRYGQQQIESMQAEAPWNTRGRNISNAMGKRGTAQFLMTSNSLPSVQGNYRFIGELSTPAAEQIYERHVLMHENPILWEGENESAKIYFESYLRDTKISPDDARALREAQVRVGATFKIHSGTYAGQPQTVKARALVAKRLKTDPEDLKIFEETLDYKKLADISSTVGHATQMKSSNINNSIDVYAQYFDEELPDVSMYLSKPKNPNASKFTSDPCHTEIKLAENNPLLSDSQQLVQALKRLSLADRKQSKSRMRGSPATCDLISVGKLFKLDGGKYHDFILFNESAAENNVVDAIRNDSEV